MIPHGLCKQTPAGGPLVNLANLLHPRRKVAGVEYGNRPTGLPRG